MLLLTSQYLCIVLLHFSIVLLQSFSQSDDLLELVVRDFQLESIQIDREVDLGLDELLTRVPLQQFSL